jgi:hypothetical protein
VRIRNKAEFFRLWEAGVLGNRTRLWRDPEEAYHWGREQGRGLALPKIGFREIGKTGGGAWEKVPWSSVLLTAFRWQKLGRKFIMDDGAPDDKRTLSGEVCRTYRGLEGSLGVFQIPMREAMAKGLLLPRSGSTILALLDRFMDPSSIADLHALLDLYPDAAVEFSCFTVNVGIFPGRNTIFWETRNY